MVVMANILIVDSDHEFKADLDHCFRNKHRIFHFEKWSQAVSCLARNEINLAIVSEQIAGFRCDQIIDMLRPSVKGQIILAGHDKYSADTRAKSRKLKADGYIYKKQKSAALFNKISSYLISSAPVTLLNKSEDSLLKAFNSAEEKKQSISKLLLENPAATTLNRLARASGQYDRKTFIDKYNYCSLILVNEVEVMKSTELKTHIFRDRRAKIKTKDHVEAVIFPLTKGVMTIGRSSNCDIQIRDSRMSKFHAYFKRQNDHHWSIKDSNSMNGTFLDGKKIAPNQESPLNERVIIGFGELCKFKLLTPEKLCIRVRYFKQFN
jgi:hypothetical protein